MPTPMLASVFRFLGALAFFAMTSVCCAALPPLLRRPVALAPSADGKWLYVANRDSRTVSVIDLTSREVVAERKLGQRLADLTFVPGCSRLLAVDEGTHELLVLHARGQEIELVQRLPVSPYPVSILVAPDGRKAMICSL